MVNSSAARLDRTFAALSDPTRRALLARLEGEEGLTVSQLAEPFAMSLPAILKHLGVLEGAGLIEREKQGRSVTCRLRPGPMEEAMAWLERYRRFWDDRLERLAALVEGREPAKAEQEEPRWPQSEREVPGATKRARSTTAPRPGKAGKRRP